MNANELRKLSLDELKKLEAELYQEGFNLKMQKATGQLSKSDLIKKNKKTIARLYTISTERRLVL